MDSRWKMAMVFAAGTFVGGTGLEALHAATATAPAYLVANIISVQDQASYDKYRAQVGPIEAKFGGEVIARTKAVKMDKSDPPEGNVLLIRFPSMKNLQDWWNSPEYLAIKPFRENATTGKEYAILELLMLRVNQVVTRNQLIETAWGYDADVSDNSIDFHMHSLRSKIDVKGDQSMIRTVRALGYSLAVPE